MSRVHLYALTLAWNRNKSLIKLIGENPHYNS